MKVPRFGYMVIMGLLLASSAAFGLVDGWLWAAQEADVLLLQKPPFVQFASAQVASAQGGGSFADEEAGIAAYVNTGTTINLDNVADLLRTTDVQTADYIVGSLELSEYSNEVWDTKVYISADGWMMAYYNKADETSKIFDWVHYDGGQTMPNLLDQALKKIAAGLLIAEQSPNYYHFAYPNADQLMLVADRCFGSGRSCEDTFEITLPAAFQYEEVSWSLAGTSSSTFGGPKAQLWVNDVKYFEEELPSNWRMEWQKFSPALPTGQLQVVKVSSVVNSSLDDVTAGAGIAVVYKGQ